MKRRRILSSGLSALWIAVAVALGLGGCAVKPVPKKELRQQALEHVAPPGQWSAAKAGAQVDAGAVGNRWFASFADSQLDALVTEALSYNTDLRAAAARVEQAGGYVKAAGAQLSPDISFIGRTGTKTGADGGLDIALFGAAWELDVWGRIRAGRNGAVEQYASAENDLQFARQSLAATVIKGWYAAVQAWLQRRLAEETVRAAQSLVDLAQDRRRVGVGDARDVEIALANLNTVEDSLRQYELAYTTALRGLELLLGRYPAAEIQVADDLPNTFAPVPVGLPSELLERRPDVIAAERRVAAAFNRVEEAKAARLPSIQLTAGVSWVSSDLLVLKEHDDPQGSFGLSLIAPLFRGGELEAQVEIRTAEQKQAVAEFGGVALKAFSDVENALTGEFTLARREPLLAAAVQANARALSLAEQQYRVGKIDLREVQTQQIDLYTARMELLSLQGLRIAQRVDLYLALGGDFGG